MPHEIVVFDAQVPVLLPIFLVSLLLLWGLDGLLGRFGLYRYVWHPPLVRLALFACVFCSLGLLVMR